MQGPTIVATLPPPEPVHYRLDLQKLTDAALKNRMELLEVQLKIARAASTVDFARNEALPLLGLDYSYRINGIGPCPHDAFDMLLDGRVEDQRLGLELTLPLGNKAARSSVQSALYSKAQLLATRRQRVLQIKQEVANALDSIESNWQRIVAARQSIKYARRNLEAEERQFGEGLRTSTDVLEAQTSLADAQSALVQARTEYEISKVDLAFATGMLLGEAAVYWEPIVPETPK